MTLPQAEIDRIKNQAVQYSTNCEPELESYTSAYIAGASREAIRGREQMVAFGVWLAKNFYVSGEIEDRWYNPAGDGYTTAELLNLFILDTQKQKG